MFFASEVFDLRENCKICQSPTREIVYQKFALLFHCCDECGFIWKDDQQKISSEAEFEIYQTHNNSIDAPHFVRYFNNFIYAAVLPYRSEGRQGLDFGSGPSPVLAMLLERDYGYRMDIYDLFYAPAKVFQGNQYDLVTCTEVVEHLADPVMYFKLLRSLLRPDGILGVMTLFHQRDDAKFLDWFYIRDLSHVSFYTPQALRLMAEKVGLQVVYTDEHRYTTLKLREE